MTHRLREDGWITIKGDTDQITQPVVPAPPASTQPIPAPNVLQSRLEFQKKRLLDRHAGLMKSLSRLIDELLAAHERIGSNDVKDTDYAALAQTLAGANWVALEANALDYGKDQLRALEGRQP